MGVILHDVDNLFSSVFLSSLVCLQAVTNLIYPAPQNDVGQFFWEHLQKDLEIIHLATGKSVDDVFLLLHFICHQITQLGELIECTSVIRSPS